MPRAVDSTARAMAGEALSRLDNGGSGSGGTTVDAYSKLETDNLLNAKVDDVEFTPIKALAESNEINITYLANNKAEKTEVNALSELVADIDSEVDLKANKADVYTKAETNTAISDKVAEIVANAPEDFDTLKELADWIDSHEDSASAMNTAIKQNTSDIATLKATDETTATEIASLQEQVTANADNILALNPIGLVGKSSSTISKGDKLWYKMCRIRVANNYDHFRFVAIHGTTISKITIRTTYNASGTVTIDSTLSSTESIFVSAEGQLGFHQDGNYVDVYMKTGSISHSMIFSVLGLRSENGYNSNKSLTMINGSTGESTDPEMFLTTATTQEA